MAPAEIDSLEIDEDAQQIDVVVAPSQLSLAIGHKGQNVRLASKLIGYKINIVVTEDDIRDVISQWTGIPLTRIAAEESQRLLEMESDLKKKIIGQDEVSTRRGSSKRFIDCPLMPVLEITDDGLVSTVGGTIEQNLVCRTRFEPLQHCPLLPIPTRRFC